MDQIRDIAVVLNHKNIAAHGAPSNSYVSLFPLSPDGKPEWYHAAYPAVPQGGGKNGSNQMILAFYDYYTAALSGMLNFL